MTSYADWVVETSTTTGPGPYNLSGAPPAGTSFFTFRQRFANGEDEIVYWVVSADRTKWEKNRGGLLTYGTPDTLTRNVVDSTDGGSAISWVGGDTPLRIYVSNDAEALELAIGMGLGATRPDALKFGIWADQDDVSSGIHTLKLFDGTSDVAIGRIDTVQHKFMPFGFETGMTMPFMGTTAPSGWILHTTTTIGDAASGATRANADTKDLFIQLWNSFANAEAAVSGGRGANAAADFAAHKTLTIPDITGAVVAGKEVVATRLTAAVSGVDGATLGETGGEQAHTLTITEMPTHTHPVLRGAALNGASSVRGTFGDGTGANSVGTTDNTGGGGAHNNVQRTIVLNYVIKL
jgi:hypothetical protein